jgi:hypothetical protein
MAKTPAAKTNYRRAIDDAIRELSELMARREVLESELEKVQWRIEAVQYGLEGLAAVSGIEPKEEYPHLFPDELTKSDVGFTDAIREVLKSAPPQESVFTAVSMRDALKERGFDLKKYQNPLASIHTVLKRLALQDEVERYPDSETGKWFYSWKRKR